MGRSGDLWQQGTLEVTGTAKYLWGPYSTGEAKDPVDIMIQNNDATGIVYVNLAGVATVSNTMFVVRPNGGTITFENIKNSISVIGSIGSNNIAYAYTKGGGR